MNLTKISDAKLVHLIETDAVRQERRRRAKLYIEQGSTWIEVQQKLGLNPSSINKIVNGLPWK